MSQRNKTLMMWALYALFSLAVLLLQDALLARVTIGGANLVLMPMALCAVAVYSDAEEGALFCLISSTLWALTGASDGGLMIFFITFFGAVCGYLSSYVLARWLVPSSLLVWGSLALSLLCQYIIHIYLEELSARSLVLCLVQVSLALPFAPVFVWLSGKIRKVGS